MLIYPWVVLFQDSWDSWNYRFLPTWSIPLHSPQSTNDRDPRKMMPRFLLERYNLKIIDCYSPSYIIYKMRLLLLWQIRPLFYLSFSDLLLGICWLIEALLYGTSVANKDVVCYNLQAVGQVSSTRLWLYLVRQVYSDLNKKQR